jgi:hypothetical protein
VNLAIVVLLLGAAYWTARFVKARKELAASTSQTCEQEAVGLILSIAYGGTIWSFIALAAIQWHSHESTILFYLDSGRDRLGVREFFAVPFLYLTFVVAALWWPGVLQRLRACGCLPQTAGMSTAAVRVFATTLTLAAAAAIALAFVAISPT